MKKINLLRYSGDSYSTIGIISEEGKEDPIFHTIEKPWLFNEKNISCIPPGSYICKPHHSEKFTHNPDIWEITDVPGRTAVLIHVANRAEQLKGCIALGLSAGYMQYKDGTIKKAVLNSSAATRELKIITNYPDPFQLNIIG